jgi:hypothetical protein
MPKNRPDAKQNQGRSAIATNKEPQKSRRRTTVGGKPVIWVPARPIEKRGIRAADAVGSSKPKSRLCDACGHKIPFGSLSTHKCEGITQTAGRVRKLSSLPRKQRYVKVRAKFQEKLSERSGGWN